MIKASKYTSAINIDGLEISVDAMVKYSDKTNELLLVRWKEFLIGKLGFMDNLAENELDNVRQSIVHRRNGGDWFEGV